MMTQEPSSAATALRETAASHMVTQIPRASMDTPVNIVIEALRGQKFECADTVFITDSEDRLEGIVRINDLFADGERRIGEIMEPEHEAVRYEDDQEQIAVLAMRLNMIAVPVVDDDERLIGAVPPEALFKILRAEHMEDLQRLAGIEPHEGPGAVLDAPLRDRFRRRLPWLMFGLLASSVITFVMTGFEETLAANVSVAFFVPALVYIAGAIGTQAVSVAVRGLSTHNVSIGKLLRDELVIGVAIGATLGTTAFIAVFAIFEDVALSLAVGLAVLGGGAVSAVVGFGLPWVFQRVGSDPALGSGPICTVIQDVASLSIYFMLVTALLT
ncbi:MAG: magnesium transporter [Alphaproteobacteria bacterium]|jgi:magnesium transporter